MGVSAGMLASEESSGFWQLSRLDASIFNHGCPGVIESIDMSVAHNKCGKQVQAPKIISDFTA